MAADMPVKAVAPVAPVPHCDWSGIYGGVNAGWGCAKVDRINESSVPNFRRPYSTTADEALIGFHLGAQWQFNSIVLGVEGAYSTGVNPLIGTHVITAGTSDPAQSIVGNITGVHSITNFYQVGARLGWAWDCWLLYASGGWAEAPVRAYYQRTDTGVPSFPRESGFQRFQGWYAGFGVENVVHKGQLVDVVAGFDYQHVEFGDTKRAFCDSNGCNPVDVIDFSVRARSLDVARFRISFKTKGWDIFKLRN